MRIARALPRKCVKRLAGDDSTQLAEPSDQAVSKAHRVEDSANLDKAGGFGEHNRRAIHARAQIQRAGIKVRGGPREMALRHAVHARLARIVLQCTIERVGQLDARRVAHNQSPSARACRGRGEATKATETCDHGESNEAGGLESIEQGLRVENIVIGSA